jgi:cytoskeletal protein RodZ
MNSITDKKVAPANTENEKDPTIRTMKWVLPIILLGLLGVGIFVWMKGWNSEIKAKQENIELNEAGNSISNAADSAAKSIKTDSSNTIADTSLKLNNH